LAPKDKRSPFEKDRDRIIHSTAFRRLQGKTQVFGLGGSDFFRTRLTHSLETAQIGKGIAIFCGLADTDLVEAACLAHDIGHPPFGHTGEGVLKKAMENHGGFEANAQNLRILFRLKVRAAI
jgi:dGTPase